MAFKAVIFDLDGTLANTLPDIAFAVNEALSHYSFPRKTEEEIKGMIGNGARVLIERAFLNQGEFIDEALKFYRSVLEENLTARTKPYPDVVETLKTLKEKNIKMAILSNKDDSHVKTITEELFPNLFDISWGYSSKYPHKPNPASLHAVIKALGVSPDEVLYVGDMSVDVTTARNANVKSVGVAWGFGGEKAFSDNAPDVLIHLPKELITLI